MDPVLQTIQTLLQLGWPGMVLVFLIVLWRAYEQRTNDYIAFQSKLLEIYMRDCPPGPDQINLIQPVPRQQQTSNVIPEWQPN